MKEIKLNKGKVALVDDGDFEYLSQFKWYVVNGYAVRNKPGGGNQVRMHREIMNAPAGLCVDHKDMDKLNNQKGNLRLCTRAQNHMNRKKQSCGRASRFKGVGINKRRYRVQFRINGKRVEKTFRLTPEGEIMAAEYYNNLAQTHFGEFARLNKI